ncbi:hypothetical protein [Flavobacterium pectinovorum]|uniref:HNH endonuclease n=1 Tax=Flavobacterium pectinovorum TaxID=29533 RepID=A0A502EMT3_9FLAO|nr:hypothetical protein [Flavobacterium pectinovorum]TPG38384.1 hypothetical protein EAH81_15745 [Flavobacterium pectinovorum]
MLNLKENSKNVREYFVDIKSKIEDRISKDGFLSTSLKNELKERLFDIITSAPNELPDINLEFIYKFIPLYDSATYDLYVRGSKTVKERHAYHPAIQSIQSIFNYKEITGNRYYLAEILKRHTCTYCNRNYIKTIGSTKDKVCRAEYDHWFNKDRYPLLALSFFNLIPSCSSCNKLKSNKNFELDTHLQPYINDLNEKFKFSYRKKTFVDNNVTIADESSLPAKTKKMIETFKIKEIYNAHSDTELRDLLDLRYKYSENYIDILINKTFKNIMSREEIYRLVFGIEINEDDFHKRPFSKFKKDILSELEIIKPKSP